jgi:C-terminal processing protease CtpA/Prc
VPDLQSTNAGSGPFMNVSRLTGTKPGCPASANRWCFVGSLLALLAALSTSVLPAGSFTSAVETIHKRELRQHCAVLASDTLEGHETGTHGGEAAGAYIVGVLRKEKHALPAAPDGDYFQPFPPNSRNILVRIPGGDAALKSEYVVVGAHYDHVGYGNSRNSRGPIGYIHNGADDNASGTAALLELVDAFCSLDVAPKRSILFIFWDSEENGLLGSQYWINSPTVPLDHIRLAFNIDMIGRLRENRAEVFGSRSAPGLRQFLSSQNTDAPVALNFTWETHRDSDHYSFFAQQIPYLMIFTGKHPEYHTPYDDVEKLNVDGMERITRLLFRAVYAAAQQPSLPPFRSAALREGPQAQTEAETRLPDPPARLGVTWDEARAKQSVVQLTEIDPGSAAASAGLQPGDRMVEFDGVRIATPDELREAVLSAADDATAVIERNGQKSPQALTVHLQGSADPIGISCRVDDAEPNCVIVNRVVAGSPASRAGLRVNDRILKVSRSTFGSLQEFGTLVAGQHGPFEVQIERDGVPEVLHVVTLKRQTGRKILLSSPH